MNTIVPSYKLILAVHKHMVESLLLAEHVGRQVQFRAYATTDGCLLLPNLIEGSSSTTAPSVDDLTHESHHLQEKSGKNISNLAFTFRTEQSEREPRQLLTFCDFLSAANTTIIAQEHRPALGLSGNYVPPWHVIVGENQSMLSFCFTHTAPELNRLKQLIVRNMDEKLQLSPDTDLAGADLLLEEIFVQRKTDFLRIIKHREFWWQGLPEKTALCFMEALWDFHLTGEAVVV